MKNKQEILGQYFTKPVTVKKLIKLLFSYKNYINNIKILEPSFGTGNFIKALNSKQYLNVDGCEIDKNLTNTPSDFFNLPLSQKYDLIIGNPPFSKYNLKESYYLLGDYLKSPVWPPSYLTKTELKKTKEKIENIFSLKSLKHLRNKNSSIGFILPVSFFIKNKNKSVKNEIVKYFSTIIIFQDNNIWFERNIPCVFAIFTNIKKFSGKILLIYENEQRHEKIIDLEDIHQELIPQVIFYKNTSCPNDNDGVPLKKFLDEKNIKVQKSYKDNNISASNILRKNKIPKKEPIENFKLAIVRVGNASVGRCGLININDDILNDMFYVFDVKPEYKSNKQIKEKICQQINKKTDYFKNITCRVGSKSIKKEDILGLKISL
jgi:hypothetical protein